MQINVELEAGAKIGESPTWVACEQALYWIDVKAPALHRYHPLSRATRSWPLPADVGAFALVEDPPGAVVALRSGVFRLAFESGALTRLAPPPFDPALFRFNEGLCDAAGRFWIGVMFDPLAADAQPPQKSALHSFTLDGGLKRTDDVSDLHNGMAWDGDGRQLYLSHSYDGEIVVYDYSLAQGRLGARRAFAQIPKLDLPDGAAVDSEGGYWCALHGAGRLRRFTAAGVFDRDIVLPVSQPTMCAFGGERLDRLYITSATDKLDAEALRREPLAGALLSLRPGSRGIPRPCLVR